MLACFFVTFFAATTGHAQGSYLAIMLGGAILGFLYFNVYPARIFMGDAGALSLGYLLSTIAILVVFEERSGPTPQPVSLALILCLPIMDTLFVMLRRLANGLSPSAADNRHLHRGLLSLGLSQSSAVSLYYVLTLAFCLLAVAMRGMPEWLQFACGVALATVILVPIAYLQAIGSRIAFPWLKRELGIRNIPGFEAISEWLRQSVVTVVVLIPVAFILPILTFRQIRSTTSFISILIGAMILAMFPWREQESREGWMHGLIYMSTILLLLHLNLNGPSWTPVYLQYATGLVAMWVGLKLVFRNHARALLTSSFELLILILAWMVPLVTPELGLDAQVQRLILHSCIESVPFLLAMKIIIRDRPTDARVLIWGMAAAFILIGIRQFLAFVR